MLHFVALVLQVCCIATKLILFYHLFLPVIALGGFCPILGSDKKKRQPEKLPLVCIDYIIAMCYNLFD
nr:MAG TPA: hypothetical protein [Bacteriophage sp.]